MLFIADNGVDIGAGDIRDRVRNGNDLVIDFHHDLVPKAHGQMAIFGILIHVLLGE